MIWLKIRRTTTQWIAPFVSIAKHALNSPHRNSIRSRCLFGVYNLCAVHGCKWCWCLCCCCYRRRRRRRHRFKFIDEMRSLTHSHTRYRRRSVLPLYRTSHRIVDILLVINAPYAHCDCVYPAIWSWIWPHHKVLESPYRQWHSIVRPGVVTQSIRMRTAADPNVSKRERASVLTFAYAQFPILLSRNVICSSSGVGMFWFRPATGAGISSLTINLWHMRFVIERLAGAIVSICFSNSVRVKSDVCVLESITFCYDAQNKLNHISTGCLSFSEVKLGKRYGHFPWAEITTIRFKIHFAFGFRFSRISARDWSGWILAFLTKIFFYSLGILCVCS